MHRIDSKYAVPELPEPAEAGTAPGYFQNGDEESETAGTVLDADWVNTVQEELVNVAEAGGQQLEKGRRDQVLAGIKALIEADPKINGAVSAAQAAATIADEADRAAQRATASAARAVEAAETAEAVSTAAEIKAEAALNMAGQSTGTFWINDESVDADDFFSGVAHYYLTNAGNANFPVAAPLYFKIEVNADRAAPNLNTSVIQTAWNEAASVWRRMGAVDRSDEENPSVDWGDWQALGGGSGGAAIGDICLMPFRATELPRGWYFANGDRYLLDSPQGRVLAGLSEGYKADWGIAISGGTINLPNLFYSDGRGFFLRAVDGTNRAVGSVQDESFKSHTHVLPLLYGPYGSGSGNGLYTSGSRESGATGGVETRPLNIGMTPAIYLGV